MEISLLDWGGDGPIALLHHANGLCAGIWGLLAEQLRPHFRVIALDARGHGDTTAPSPTGGAYAWIEFVNDLVPLAERLAEERGAPIALGIGNSFGGLVTAYAAALRPALFSRIVMLDPVILPPHLMAEMIEQMPGSDSKAFESRRNPLAEVARRRQEVWPSREVARRVWARKELFRDWDPRALQLYVEEGMRDREDGQVELKCGREVEASVFDASGGLDLFPVAHRIEAPTLLARASRGHFQLAVYQALAERIPDACTLELDIDHLMPAHNPPELAETILAFALDQ